MPITTLKADRLNVVMYELSLKTDKYGTLYVPLAEFYAVDHYGAFAVCETLLCNNNESRWWGANKTIVELNYRNKVTGAVLEMVTNSEGDYESTTVAEWKVEEHQRFSEMIYVDAPDTFHYSMSVTSKGNIALSVNPDNLDMVKQLINKYFNVASLDLIDKANLINPMLIISLAEDEYPAEITIEHLSKYLDRRY